MTVSQTTNLSLPIITTGTESGTWGDVVDNGLTSYLDIAIAGGLAVTITTANVTLSLTSGTSSATNIGSTTAQYAILNISGAKTAARSLIVPSSSKYYVINNAGTGGFLLTVKGAATTGITMVDGENAVVAWNGTDFVKVSSNLTGVPSVNGGQLAGLRNRVINGQGWINQRGSIAVTAGLQYGPDRMMASITSGTSISGNIASGSLTGTNTLYGWGLNACSWTTGAVQLAQRIESWNVLDMNSKTVTFSGKLYQDTGGSRTFNIIIQKATAGVDNFTTTSTISSTTVVVPTATTTPFSFTTTLGASDATNGIMLILSDTVVNTAVSKTYFTSDWQFEISPVATTFEQRPYGMELALCQRYLPAYRSSSTIDFLPAPGLVISTTDVTFIVPFPVPPRVPPTGLLVSSSAHFTVNAVVGAGVAGAVTFSNGGANSARILATSSGVTAGQSAQLYFNNASAYLYFTGCEL
jgi:hypothetical protein